MKFKTLFFPTALLLFFLSCSQTFGEEKPNLKKWVASCEIDKITDDKSCQTIIMADRGRFLYAIIFKVIHSQEYGNVYGFYFYAASYSNDSESDNCQNSNVVRIDKNDAIDFEGTNLIGDMANPLIEQMLTGKTAIAKCGDDDFTFPLNGFREGYEFVKENMAFDP